MTLDQGSQHRGLVIISHGIGINGTVRRSGIRLFDTTTTGWDQGSQHRGFRDHKPWGRDQRYRKEITDPVFRPNNNGMGSGITAPGI